jgi:hypothetical protein
MFWYCGECKHWKESGLPSGTGNCKITGYQMDETRICNCTKEAEGGSVMCFEAKNK